jgi:glycosyltransferase involved in cell wall biosynthesis
MHASSRYEIFGMTVLESIACGTPVILTESCGIAEYFRDEVGLVFKTDSPHHLQEAVLEMLTNQKRQKFFRENCKAVVEKFDISNSVSLFEKVYEETNKYRISDRLVDTKHVDMYLKPKND